MPFRRTILGLAVALILLHIVATAALGTGRGGIIASNLLQIAVAALASAACLLRSRGQSDFSLRFWRLFGASFALWTLGQAIYSYYVLYLRLTVPSIYPGDIPFLGFYLPLAAALFLAPPGWRRRLDWTRTLDLAQVAIVLTSVYLYVFFFIASSVGSRAAFLQVQGIFYDVANLVLAASFLLRAATEHASEARRLYGTGSLFVVAYALGDGIYGYALRHQLAGTGTWFDLGYTAPFAVATVAAALWRPQAESPAAEEEHDPFSPLPMLAPLIVLAMALRIASEQMTLAFVVATSSFLCYSARLAVTQHERKQARKALSESEEELSRLFHTSPDAITISTFQDGRYLAVNEAFLAVTGYTHDEVIGRTSLELGFWSDPKARAAMLERVRAGEKVRNVEVSFRMRSGEERQFLLSADVVALQGRRCLVAFSRDITERRQLEQQFRQAQKMEAVGRLAGGIAHDFNNLLTVISGYVELLLEESDGRGRAEMQQVLDAADRAATLTKQLLAFSRRQVLKPRVIDLNTVVHGLEKLLRRLVGEDVRLELVLAERLGAVRADPGQIEQVIMNLAVNARDAMPQGGTLRVATDERAVDAAWSASQPGLAPGEYVTLTVCDTGVGMDRETQARIFEPFFTTKELGRGTGLGLSTVYGIVKQSGGYILAESAPMKGATFTVFLPRVGAAVTPDGYSVATAGGDGD